MVHLELSRAFPDRALLSSTAVCSVFYAWKNRLKEVKTEKNFACGALTSGGWGASPPDPHLGTPPYRNILVSQKGPSTPRDRAATRRM